MGEMSGAAVGVTIAVISSIVGTLGKQLLRYAELQRQSGGSWAGKAQLFGVLGQMVMSPVLDIVAQSVLESSTISSSLGFWFVDSGRQGGIAQEESTCWWAGHSRAV
eukprot:COSAG02_NODE_2281_length_9231_cov_15.017959_12_plen_107_part_00